MLYYSVNLTERQNSVDSQPDSPSTQGPLGHKSKYNSWVYCITIVKFIVYQYNDLTPIHVSHLSKSCFIKLCNGFISFKISIFLKIKFSSFIFRLFQRKLSKYTIRWFSIRPCIKVWKKIKFWSPYFLLIYTFSF